MQAFYSLGYVVYEAIDVRLAAGLPGFLLGITRMCQVPRIAQILVSSK